MLDTILALARVFHTNGYELYMVGGTVRDLLMHRDTPPDADLATNARPDEIKRLANLTNPDAVVSVGEQFGTVRLHYRRESPQGDSPQQVSPEPRALVAPAGADIDIVEITTYRSDVYNPESRKPEVTFGNHLEDDLLRRDFTINAIARDPLTGELIDPYGGRADLEQGIIRAVGDDPEHRFDEDPLRMLRAARFAAQFKFEIEPKTAAAMGRQASTLQKISRERIRDEFTKLLVTPNPGMGLRLLVDLALMPYIVPEVLDLRGVSQQPADRKPAPSKDVYAHVLRVVERSPARPASRWAGLLHDIAKPRTRTVENGKIHFFGHEDVGAVMTRDILKRLRFDRPFIEHVSRLVRMHMRVNAYTPDWTDGAVRRLMLEARDTLQDLLDLSRADITSYRPEKVSRAVARIDELEARCRWLREEAERVPLKSPLDGNDLMRLFNREPGPWLRPLKDYLLGLVLDGQLTPDDVTGAERLAREFMARQDGAGNTTAGQPSAAKTTGEPGLTQEPVDENAEAKRVTRVASRRKSRQAVVESGTQPEGRNGAQLLTSRMSQSGSTRPRAHLQPSSQRASESRSASRTGIIGFLSDYLEVDRFRDVAPNGLQVTGKTDVRRIVLGVSANLALFQRAVESRADMIIVHHGLFLDRESHVIHERLKRRLKMLFDHDITLLGYHLPLDAHPVVGNNAQWLRRLDFAVESHDFGVFAGQAIGMVGRRDVPLPVEDLVTRITALTGSAPRTYLFGPAEVRRLAVVTGGAPGDLDEAIARDCDCYLTGEVAEGTQAIAAESHANFIAAGHYNTERFGVQALGEVLQREFGVETVFIDVPNDV